MTKMTEVHGAIEQRRLACPPDVKIIHLFTSDRMSQGRMCSLRFFVPSAERFCPTDFFY